MSGSGVPPVADSRIARMPQVGASAQEIGRTHSGSRDSGTRNPQISQTGYSVIAPSAHAERYRAKATAIRKPSAPIERIVAGMAAAKSSGDSIVRSIPNTTRPQKKVVAMQ